MIASSDIQSVSNWEVVGDYPLVREFKEVACKGVHDMTVGIWYRLILDRIHLSMSIVSKEHYGIVMGQLEEMKAMQAQLVPLGRIGIRKKQYSTRLDYHPRKKGGKIADIEVGVTPEKHMYFRLGLYPSKFRGADFEVLKSQLNAFFGHDFYESVYGTARVSYIELAVDSLKLERANLIPFRSRTNQSSIYENKDGSKGSVYLGGLKSDTRFCIYDKARQLADTKQSGHSQHKVRTRIEARLRHTKLSPCELVHSLPNPFKRLGLADRNSARLLTDNGQWHDFLDGCETAGSAATLSQCSKETRKKNMDMLRTCRVANWNPDYFWEGLPVAIAAIEP